MFESVNRHMDGWTHGRTAGRMDGRRRPVHTILRGTRNLSLVSIRFRLFDEKRKNSIKFDEIELKKESQMRSRYSKNPL